MSSPWEDFCLRCSRLAPGPISDTTELERLLAAYWDELNGDDGGMEGYKLLGRMEAVVWKPILSFRIERHGGTVIGSSHRILWRRRHDHQQTVVTAEVIRRIPVRRC